MKSHPVEISRPDKLLWPSLGVTKRLYADYLSSVATDMLPWLRERPLTLVRAPDGITGQRYFQKAASPHTPGWIRTVEVAGVKRDVTYVVCEDDDSLQWLANQATVEFHPSPARVDRLDRPDLLVVDIDPPERDGSFEAAVEVALLVAETLSDLGLGFGIKTTGGKGLHVVIPLERRFGYAALRSAAEKITQIVADRRPELVTSEFRKANRKGRVMIDPSRNGPGATIVAPYSARVTDGATVSFPVVPEELGSASPADFTLRTVSHLLERPGPRQWRSLAGTRGRLPSGLR